MNRQSNSFRSVCEMYHRRVDSTPNAVAMYGRSGTGWTEICWKEVAERVRRITCGLLSLGITPEDRCAIMAETCPEWVMADMGILCAAATTTTLYPTSSSTDCVYILDNSETVFCFAGQAEHVDKLRAHRAELPGLRHVISFEEVEDEEGWVLSLAELERLGRAWDEAHPEAYEDCWQAVGPDHLATLIYTSGTTGPPKGVMLNHDNWVFEGEAIDKMAVLEATDLQYLFLPLAHAFAKVLEIAFIRLGIPTVVDGDLERLIEGIGETRPTVMGAVPRVFEKAYDRIRSAAEEAGGNKTRIFHWAMGIGARTSALRQRGLQPKGLLAKQQWLAHRLVFSKIQGRFGGRIKCFVSGGAPLSREIQEFFDAAGMPVLEGYGLTESSAATFANRLEEYKFGTVGLPVPGMEVRLAKDGEILLKGRGVMQGYYKLPEATAEILVDGWLHTGDIGTLDEEGFLQITDRKKDLIVTAGGKNISPQNIENALKVRSRYVSQVVVHGDNRPYCVALITVNEESTGQWAQSQGLSFSGYAELASLVPVQELIWQDVSALNRSLASYETIKRVHLLGTELSEEGGELTPTLKVKRRVVFERHAKELEALYEGSA